MARKVYADKQVTGSISATSGLTLSGANSPLTLNTNMGTTGQLLASNGTTNTPTWVTSTAAAVRVAANRTTTAGGTALAANAQETATTVTFPVGRFTVIPAVVASTNSPRYVAAVTSVATTGFTMIVRNVSDATGTTYTWNYQAIEIVAGMGN
jgi:hypothetical protein